MTDFDKDEIAVIECVTRAAVVAMREPTPEMIEAGIIAGCTVESTVVRIWQAMIDAALMDEPATENPAPKRQMSRTSLK